MEKLKTTVRFYDREADQVREVGDKFSADKGRANTLVSRGLAEIIKEPSENKKATLD